MSGSKYLAFNAIMLAFMSSVAGAQVSMLEGSLSLPNGAPIAGYPITVESGDGAFVVLTDPSGRWSLPAAANEAAPSGIVDSARLEEYTVKIPNGPTFNLQDFAADGLSMADPVVIEPY